MKFGSGADCEHFIPRKAIMPAPAPAMAGSALPRAIYLTSAVQ
jgi:hypothetical protein